MKFDEKYLKKDNKSGKDELNRREQEKRDIDYFKKMIPRLNEKYQDYFRGKISREPKKLRRELEGIIKKYRRSPFVRTVYKFKFSNLVSKYNLYKSKWDIKLREMRRDDMDINRSNEMSDIAKKRLNQIIDEM